MPVFLRLAYFIERIVKFRLCQALLGAHRYHVVFVHLLTRTAVDFMADHCCDKRERADVSCKLSYAICHLKGDGVNYIE